MVTQINLKLNDMNYILFGLVFSSLMAACGIYKAIIAESKERIAFFVACSFVQVVFIVSDLIMLTLI